jgi:hypothetical protein
MTLDNLALVLDLVEWVATKPRTYAELMGAWRTSCPRLAIWEDAVDAGFVRREICNGVATVVITSAGITLLQRAGRLPTGVNYD